MGRLLVDRGYITPAQLEDCVQEQDEFRRHSVSVRLGQILLRRRLISTVQLVEVLREQNPAAAPESQGVSNHISRYEILQEAGRGGMSIVYRALDREQARLVALKIMKKEMAFRPEAVARFNREASTISHLQHPNVVSVLDYGEEQGQPFFVMELVEGPSLADLFKERTMDRRKILEILRKVALAAQCAHEHGIIHRDIKPGNILLDSASEPRLSDFGLAHFAGAENAITRPGVVLGTPLYMAPEQVTAGVESVDARTDVYAMGAVLYEAVAGRPPFLGDSPTELYRKILEEDVVAPSRLQGDIPRDLEAICLTALAKEPGRRYATAKDFADDLGRYLSGEPVRARRPSIFRKLWRGARRRPVAVALILATLTTLAGIGVWQFLRQLDRRRAVRDLTSRARSAMDFRKWSEARELLVRALEIDPAAYEPAALREKCRLEMDREKDSLVHALAAGAKIEIILQDRESRQANLTAVDEMIRETDRELDDALRINPGLAVGWYQKGRLEALRWRFEAAREALDRAVALDRTLISARFERAKLVILELVVTPHPEWPASVLRDWKRAVLDRNKDDFRALTEHPKDKPSTLPSQALSVHEILQAFLLFETSPNEGPLAIESLEDAERRFHDRQISIWIGILKRETGESERARELLDRAVDERPYSILGRWALARVLEKLNDIPGALEQWEFAGQIDPGNRTLELAHASCLESAGRFEDALKRAEPFDDPESSMVRGRALLGLSRWSDAEKEFSKVLQAQPKAVWAQVERARAFAGQKLFKLAIDDLEKASASAPEAAEKVASLLEEYRHQK